MYRLMSFFRQITYFLTDPTRALRWRAMSAVPRPFMGLRSSWYSLRSSLAGFNRFLPQRLRRTSDRDKKRKPPTEGIEVNPKPARPARRRARRVATRMEFAQVHLIHVSGDRQVVHIGSPVSAVSADLLLNDRHAPVTLRFTQDDSALDTVIWMALIEGAPYILVNDQKITSKSEPVLIHTGTRVGIGTETYLAELHVADDVSAEVGVDAHWMTSSGLAHDINEDAIGFGRHDAGTIFVVADGVQGGYAGEKVSEFAVQYLLLVFKRNIPLPLAWPKIYRRAFERINDAVRRYAERSPDHAGTTLTAILLRGWSAHIAHVGDSRIYLLRKSRLSRLTKDHVVASRPVIQAAGEGKPPSVKYPRLSKAIGKAEQIDPDLFTITIQPGDRLLLCTDGVSDAVSDDELAVLMRTEPRTTLPQTLIERANARPMPDNASAIVLDIQSQPLAEDWWDAAPQPRTYRSDRVQAARLSHSTAYETVYRRPRRVNWSVVTAAVLVIIAVLSVAGAIRSLQTAGAAPTGAPDTAATQEPSVPDGAGGQEMLPQATATDATDGPGESALPAATERAPLPTSGATLIAPPTAILPPTSTIRPSEK